MRFENLDFLLALIHRVPLGHLFLRERHPPFLLRYLFDGHFLRIATHLSFLLLHRETPGVHRGE